MYFYEKKNPETKVLPTMAKYQETIVDSVRQKRFETNRSQWLITTDVPKCPSILVSSRQQLLTVSRSSGMICGGV